MRCSAYSPRGRAPIRLGGERLFAWGEGESKADLACDFFESRTYDHDRQEVHRRWVTES